MDGTLWSAGSASVAIPQPSWQTLLTPSLVEDFEHTPGILARSVGLDSAAVAISFGMANQCWGLVRALRSQDSLPHISTFPSGSLGALLIYASLLTLSGYSEHLYAAGQSPVQERLVVIKVVIITTLLMAVATLLGIDELPLPVMMATAPLLCGAMIGWRMWRKIRVSKPPRSTRNLLIAGNTSAAQRLAEHYDRCPECGYRVCGFLEAAPAGRSLLGSLDELAQVARAEFADEIILAMPLHSAVAMRAVREARRNRLDIKIIPDTMGFAADSMENIADIPIVSLHRETLPAFALLAKRMFDILGSLALLLAAFPLLAAIAIAIRVDSRGPVLYRATRAGRKGRHFLCYKFRTMVCDANAQKTILRAHNERTGPFFKMRNDPRITEFGRILRRYSLDELPQLWNVLKGDMSLVGPRPHPLDDVQGYDLDHLRRLDVTPGLTGLWQVTARQDASFQTNLALDVEYIEHWSLWMDMRILCKTFTAVLKGTGT